jgi:cysteine desulfurase
LSAHKLGGPKGVGALIVREGAPSLPSLITGGGQERRRRAGTENVAGIAGFGAAAAAAQADLALVMPRVRALRDRLEREVRDITPEAVIVAEAAERLPNTTSLALPGASAETLVIALDLKGVAVSAGAACSSGKVGASHVLSAMGLAPQVARAAIRISLGPRSGEGDIASFLEAWAELALARRARAVA